MLLRKLRLERRITQGVMAKTLGYKSYQAVQKWENGKNPVPTAHFNDLARMLEVDVSVLWDALHHTEKNTTVYESTVNKQRGKANKLASKSNFHHGSDTAELIRLRAENDLLKKMYDDLLNKRGG